MGVRVRAKGGWGDDFCPSSAVAERSPLEPPVVGAHGWRTACRSSCWDSRARDAALQAVREGNTSTALDRDSRGVPYSTVL